jgi:hypothetical protein
MFLNCPKCDSRRIDTRHYGRRTGSTIGALAGAVGVAASIYRGAELGAMAGTLTGPVGTVIGTVTGAIIGGLLGGATGGAVGAKLGEVIDINILENHRCLDCGFTFCSSNTETGPFPQANQAASNAYDQSGNFERY